MAPGEFDSAVPLDRPKLYDRIRWVTLIVGVACVFATCWRGYTYLHYDVGNPALQTPTTRALSSVSALVLALALLSSLVMGLLTLPRWQGFLALGMLGWSILACMGL